MTLLRKHGLWLVVATLAGVVGALLFYVARPASYASTAQVDVEPNTSVPGTPVVPNMATEVQVATSGAVLGTTAKALGKTPSELSGHLSASVSGTASLMSISCTMPTAAAAQHCARTAAASYIAYRDQVTSSTTSQAHDPLDVTLVTPASLPTAAAGPGKRILLPIGAVLGLMLGIGAIFVRDAFDHRVRDRADLERCLDGPVLGEIPRIQGAAADPARVFSQAPLSRAAEAYRYIRSHLQLLADSASGGATVLQVASAQRGAGSTCVAANVATALAQANSAVILVDADLRHPSLTEVFRVAERPGLAELLAESASCDDVAVPTNVPGLRLVTAGEVPGQAADIIEPERLARAFDKMRATADFIVVNSAPLLVASDAVILARASDLVMVVADVRRTERASVSAAAQEIRATGPRTIVGVLNGAPSPEGGPGRFPESGPGRFPESGQERFPESGQERFPESGQERSPASRAPQSPAPSPGVSAILAGTAPPLGANGQLRHEAVIRHRTDTEE